MLSGAGCLLKLGDAPHPGGAGAPVVGRSPERPGSKGVFFLELPKPQAPNPNPYLTPPPTPTQPRALRSPTNRHRTPTLTPTLTLAPTLTVPPTQVPPDGAYRHSRTGSRATLFDASKGAMAGLKPRIVPPPSARVVCGPA